MSSIELQEAFDSIPYHRRERFVISYADNAFRMEGRLGDEHARAPGMAMAHGGAVAGLLDTATTFAAVASTQTIWATVDIRVDYLRPTPLGSRGTLNPSMRKHVLSPAISALTIMKRS